MDGYVGRGHVYLPSWRLGVVVGAPPMAASGRPPAGGRQPILTPFAAVLQGARMIVAGSCRWQAHSAPALGTSAVRSARARWRPAVPLSAPLYGISTFMDESRPRERSPLDGTRFGASAGASSPVNEAQAASRWKRGDNPLMRLLGKEFTLLACGIETADPALKNSWAWARRNACGSSP